jgi:hypothetical protein
MKRLEYSSTLPHALQYGELPNGAVGERRPKTCVHQLHKLWPSRSAAVELHPVQPQLGVVQQVEGRERHVLVLRCPAHMKIALTAVEPREGIARAIELQEF